MQSVNISGNTLSPPSQFAEFRARVPTKCMQVYLRWLSQSASVSFGGTQLHPTNVVRWLVSCWVRTHCLVNCSAQSYYYCMQTRAAACRVVQPHLRQRTAHSFVICVGEACVSCRVVSCRFVGAQSVHAIALYGR